MKFSANLGFLFKEFTLPQAVLQAKECGFDAVECHWPYEVPSNEVKNALQQSNLKMLGLNTIQGGKGENGLAALSDKVTEARKSIEQAIEYANDIQARNIHVMCGFSSGEKSHKIFVDNLRYACKIAKPLGITILIEPLNHYDAPGYFLQTSKQAKEIINEVNQDNLKLMFDCYHIQLIEGNLTNKLKELFSIIGHIQFASVPNRAEPDQGEINYSYLFKRIKKLGYKFPIGAEYKPMNSTKDGLKWMKTLVL